MYKSFSNSNYNGWISNGICKRFFLVSINQLLALLYLR